MELLENGYTDLAKYRFMKALKYNPNSAVANYYLFKINSANNNQNESQEYLTKFKEVLKNADEDFLELFDLTK